MPVAGPGEVLVEVDHCGICGSDIHMLLDGWGTSPGWWPATSTRGSIVAVGDGVEGWAVGEDGGRRPVPQVRALPALPRGQALPVREPVRTRSWTGHDGAFARYVLVRATALLRLPDGALGPPRGTGRAPGRRPARHHPLGRRPRGHASWSSGPARSVPSPSPPWWPGASGPITAVEPGERRQAAGPGPRAPTEVLDPGDLESSRPGSPSAIAERAVHVVLECSGKKAAMEAGFHQLRRGGTLALVGAGIEHPTFDPNRFILNELDRVRLVHLRQGRVRAGARAPGLGRPAQRAADRARRRAPRRDLRGPRAAWPTAASPAR